MFKQLINEHVPIGWASFLILELVSSSSFDLKRLGYILASSALKNDPHASMMVANLVKKVSCFSSGHPKQRLKSPIHSSSLPLGALEPRLMAANFCPNQSNS